MNALDWILILLIAVILVFAVRGCIIGKKKGKNCPGCGENCETCGGCERKGEHTL